MDKDMMDDKGGPGDINGQVDSVLDAATKGGELAPLEALVKEEGLDCTAAQLLKYAQDDPDTHGKKPAELAAMLRADPTLVKDIIQRKDGEDNKAMSSGENFESVRKKASPKDDDGGGNPFA